jgi:hypothetical protein
MPAAASQRVTAKKRARFLEALRETGHVGQAARKSRCCARTLFRHRLADAAFATAWEAALQEAMDTVLEPEAVRRAVTGVEKPVYQGGEKVGTIREYSDTLLIFLLKGGKPAKYRERHEHVGEHGGPLALRVVYDNAPIAIESHDNGFVKA